jgi:hypothetical protein
MMKYVQTIWRMASTQSAAERESWLGSLVATLEANFSISCSFVILPEHQQRVLTWLESKAVGSYSVEELRDEQIAVAVGTRQDAVQLRAIHRHCVDQSVVVANRSPEQIRGFIGQLKGRLAS